MQRMDERTRRQWLTTVAAAALGVRTASAQPAGSLRIGQVLPLSGPLAQTARPLVEGQAACIEEINAAGGIQGQRIELITLDDGFDPARTLAQTHVLLDEKNVVGLFGYGTGSGIAAVLPLLAERKVPLLGLYTGADQLRAPHPCLFTTTASYGDELRQMIRHLVTLRSVRLGAAVLATDGGRAQLGAVRHLCGESGAQLLASRELAVDGSDAAQAAELLVGQGLDAILMVAAGKQVTTFVQAVAGRVPVYTLSVAGSSAFLKALGPAARGLVVSQIVPYPWRTTSALTRRFTAAMNRSGLEIGYDRMWGYLNASILVEALRRTGRTATPATLTTALEGMSDVDLGGYRLAYTKASRHGSRFVEITMVGAHGDYVR